jgi:HK97 family phage portal protein
MNRMDHFLAAFGLARPETREADPRLHPDVWNRAFPSSAFASAGGVESNIAQALACVHRQATVLAGLPFAPYRRLADGGRERIRDGSLARIIDAPNAWQSRFDFIESIVRALHFHGNYYAEVRYGADGLFESFVPLSPNAVTVEQTTSGAVRLKVSEPGGTRVLVQGEHLHVKMPGHGPTDLTGVSTVQRARGALGLALELNDAARESAKKTIGGYLIQHSDTNQRSKRQQSEAIKQTAADRFAPQILDPGAKFIPTTFSNADAELLASRQLAAQDVCLIFGMTPGMFGLLDTSSYGSAAQAAQDFVTTCLGPLAERIESAFEHCLLSEEMRADVFFEFELDGLLRTDPSERFRQYEIGRRVGLYSPNDLRRLENLPPRTDAGGDAFDAPSTSAPAQTEPPIASAT